MAIKGYIDADSKILADNMNAPYIRDAAGIAEAIGEEREMVLSNLYGNTLIQKYSRESESDPDSLYLPNLIDGKTTCIITMINADAILDTTTAINVSAKVFDMKNQQERVVNIVTGLGSNTSHYVSTSVSCANGNMAYGTVRSTSATTATLGSGLTWSTPGRLATSFVDAKIQLQNIPVGTEIKIVAF